MKSPSAPTGLKRAIAISLVLILVAVVGMVYLGWIKIENPIWLLKECTSKRTRGFQNSTSSNTKSIDMISSCSGGGPQFRIHERRYNALPTEYDRCLKAMLQIIIDENLSADHPLVIRLIKELLEPPSHHLLKLARPVVTTKQSIEIMKILKKKKNGYYVEVGGLDGERGSNTLWLESMRSWDGLLIEMDPYFYTMLKGHSRRAWSINCCLSPNNKTTVMDFKESSGGGGQLVAEPVPKDSSAVIAKVPCFPLSSILQALNQTKIDYFSVDVEGFELDILRTVPFGAVDVSTLSVEFIHGREGKQAYLDFMKQQGYSMTSEVHAHDNSRGIHVDDFIFAKQSLA